MKAKHPGFGRGRRNALLACCALLLPDKTVWSQSSFLSVPLFAETQSSKGALVSPFDSVSTAKPASLSGRPRVATQAIVRSGITERARPSASMARQSGRAVVSWDSLENRQYRLQFSDDLRSWRDLCPAMFGNGREISVADDMAGPGARFYRLVEDSELTIDVSLYTPMAAGNTWTYNANGNPYDLKTSTVLGETQRKGRQVWEIETRPGAGGLSSSTCYRQTEQGLY